jgi:hypothetical protein
MDYPVSCSSTNQHTAHALLENPSHYFCIQDCFTQSHKYRYPFFPAKFKSYVTSTWAAATGCMLTRLVSFYILLTVHLVVILGKWPTWRKILFYVFISILYMFRETSCSSSGESIVSIQYLVYVTLCRWPLRVQVGKSLTDLHTKRSPTQSDTYTRGCIDTIDCRYEHEVARNM